MNSSAKQKDPAKIDFLAAQAASLLVCVCVLSLSIYGASINQGDLVNFFNNLFPKNIYIFVFILVLAFGLITLTSRLKSTWINTSFKKAFLLHFSYLSGMAIVLLGLVSKIF